MAVTEVLSEEECYLVAILEDLSGIDFAEFAFYAPESDDGCWRARPYQYEWFRCEDQLQIDQCIAAGQFVLTRDGWIPIEQVAVGAEVLTHRNRWRRVTAVMAKGRREVVRIKGQGHGLGLRMTADHRIWARHSRRASQPLHGHTGKRLGLPAWIRPSEWEWNDGSGVMVTNWAVSPADFPMSGLPQPMVPAYRSGRQNYVRDVLQPEWLWLYGLYLAEGSTYAGRNGDLTHRTRWSVHPSEVDAVCGYLDAVGLHYSLDPINGEECTNVCVTSRPVVEWLRRYGHGIANTKQIAIWAHGLDDVGRRAVFDGLIFGDGYTRPNGRHEHSTSSVALAHGMKMLGASLGHTVGVTLAKDVGTSLIRGRTVNRGRLYTVGLQPEQDHCAKPRLTISDGWAWAPVYSIDPDGEADVWDIEVEEDHSFVVEGVAVHNCARDVGKSLSIKLRACVFPFNFAGQEMLLTAPELIHLEPIASLIENQLLDTRLTREMVKRGRSAINHRPLMINFENNARIMGRIPQRTGRGAKGVHAIRVEQDEASDYPEQGWTELNASLKRGYEKAQWRAHGVTRGIRGSFFNKTQPGSGWTVHRITAMMRENWTAADRAQAILDYGSAEDPDYRRNILGLHGDASNALFVLRALMRVCDIDLTSDYNTDHYFHRFIRDTDLDDPDDVVSGSAELITRLNLPPVPAPYATGGHQVWVGMDVGFTSDPTEIVIAVEYHPSKEELAVDKANHRAQPAKGTTRLRAIGRITLRRISGPLQTEVILHVIDHYNPRAFSMDRTGNGLPLFQGVLGRLRTAAGDNQRALKRATEQIKGYNFSENVLVEIDDPAADRARAEREGTAKEATNEDVADEAGVKANVLEYSTDVLRAMVDSGRLMIPWDKDSPTTSIIDEMHGQTFSYSNSPVDAYGRRRRQFSEGRFHTLDALRMLVMGMVQQPIEEFVAAKPEVGPVIDRPLEY